MIAPEIVFQVPGKGVSRQALRDAEYRRRRRARRLRYAGMMRVMAVTAVVVVLLMAYLAVIANMTGTNTALNAMLDQRAALQEETMRLDDQIAKLESRERLSAVAASLKMQRTSDFLVVNIPRTGATVAQASGPIALLNSVEHWLKVR
jgi:cell division protein FtsL